VVLGLIAWEHIDTLKQDESRGMLAVLLCPWLVSAVAYLAARYAKKRGLLAS
jgi:hypothetical protein